MTAYPEFAKWRREIVERARRGERLTTHFGRPLPEFASQKAYQSIAYTIQGTAADLFKMMMRKVARELQADESGIELWLPLHDELILSAPDETDTIAQALDILARHMRAEINGVMIAGEPQAIGKSWRKV
jgi:DNA polymerase I-like protein with 3'-5' exonuclease and polymerase domains